MNCTTKLYFDRIETHIGDLIMAAGENGLHYVTFQDRCAEELQHDWIYSPANMVKYTTQIKEYFTGERQHFDLPLHPQGTPFQQKIWQALIDIPFGSTITYAKLAEMADNPGACRAAGNANGKNPIVIIQPCHRVVAANAKLGGFSAGLYRKSFLLGLEKGINTLF